MKILQIIDALESGGKERQALELLKGLKANNNLSVKLVVLSDSNDFPYSKELGIPIFNLVRKYKYDLSIILKLYKIVKEFRPDIIHSWNLMCSIFVLPVYKLLRIKFVNGVIRDCPLKIKKFSKIWAQIRITFPFSDIVLANSSAGLKAYSVSTQKGVFIHNGFDKNRASNQSNQKKIRKQFSIHTKYVIGMVARFSYMKDYETYLATAKYIHMRREDVTFLAIGDGPKFKELFGKYSDPKNKHIRFLGNQTNVEPLIDIFDIGILTTNHDLHGEGISNSIMEYMAFSKPVIATLGGGTEELVCDGKTGFLIEATDTSILAKKIEYLLDNPERAKKMGEAGRLRLTKEFGLDKMTNEHIELYQNIIKT